MVSPPDQARRGVQLALVGFVGLVVLAAGLAVWALDVDPIVGWAWFTAGALLAGFAGYLGARRSLARLRRAARRLPWGAVLLAAVAGAGLGALLWEAVTPAQLMAILGLGAGLVTGLLVGSRPTLPCPHKEGAMARVVHFEIPVDDPERSQTFYRELFGWDIAGDPDEGYWLATTGPADEPGINGALINRGPVHNTPVIVIQVASVEEFLARAEAAGGQVLHGKHTIPHVGYSGYLQDPEGNVVGIFQPDTSARG